MRFTVSQDCLALGLRAGAVVFHNVRVGVASAELRAAVAREAAAIRARFAEPRAISSLPEVAGFQDVLRQVGVNPKREKPSVARLLTLALKRGELPEINNLVDSYNLVSVRTLCSLGAHDLDRLALPVTLRLLTGSETFTPLGSNRPEQITPGQFGYVDAANRVLCRLDVLQADFSLVTAATQNALLIVEGTTTHAPQTLRQALDETIAWITRECGGEAEVVAYPGQ